MCLGGGGGGVFRSALCHARDAPGKLPVSHAMESARRGLTPTSKKK